MATGSLRSFDHEKLDLRKLHQAKRMRQRAALDLFSSFTPLNFRGYFGEPLEHVRTPHVSRQSHVAMKDGPDIVMRSSSARSCFARFLRRKQHEQRSLRTRVSPERKLEEIAKIEAERLVDPRVDVAKQEEEEASANEVMEIDGGSDAEKPCPTAFSQSTVCEFVGDGK